MRTKRVKRKHWYRLYVGECPVCGCDQSSRERVYGKRPAKRRDRVVYLSDSASYCGCLRID